MSDHVQQEIAESIEEVLEDVDVRPRRENAGAGVERLEFMHGSQNYASTTHIQFLTVKGHRIRARERENGKSFMIVNCFFERVVNRIIPGFES